MHHIRQTLQERDRHTTISTIEPETLTQATRSTNSESSGTENNCMLSTDAAQSQTNRVFNDKTKIARMGVEVPKHVCESSSPVAQASQGNEVIAPDHDGHTSQDGVREADENTLNRLENPILSEDHEDTTEQDIEVEDEEFEEREVRA
ncbi:hypothetical protein IFR05_011659 [Cadophora sp. M221]|nr:hypothetical protein IFR05_011659 [Cadophora sp. M221]